MKFTGYLIACVCLMTSLKGVGQDRCAFDTKQKNLLQKNPSRKQERFEDWLNQKIDARKKLNQQYRTTAGSYQIPVVVHVIHNGEPIGTGLNISDAQIASQLKVLNNDYQRLNADLVNTPAAFQAVAAGVDLEFVMAKQDPEGLPTNGIVRVKGTKNGWTLDDEYVLKNQSYWPAENYLNIWVVNQTDSYVGYAQFPVSNLGGLGDASEERLTDGVVIDYRAFGSIDDGNFNLDSQFNKGRTATHEIGHFLGLLHTFEGGCNGPNDYVADTPALSEPTRNCPSHPATSCSTTKMFQNFLDYTDDVCMNLFTQDQITRVVTILDNSPRRQSLTISPALTAPTIPLVDAEVRKVIAPETNTCSQLVAPKVVLRNRGSSIIQSVVASFTLNGTLLETKQFLLNLASFESDTLAFSPITLPEPSNNTVSFRVTMINGTTDSNSANNEIVSASVVNTRLTPPVIESFNSLPANWTIQNPDNGITWSNTTASAASMSNRAMSVNFYNYKQESYQDYLYSPFIDLTSTNSAVLKFDHAYARFPNRNLDSLRVSIFTDCQTDPQSATTVFLKGGSNLATTNDTNASFQPTNQNQWRTNIISLLPFQGKNIQLRFESVNGYGNNLFVDNIQIVTEAVDDIGITRIVYPAPVVCTPSIAPKLKIQNLGSSAIHQVQITPSVNGSSGSPQTFSDLNLASGAELDLTLPSLLLQNGNNTITFTIANPDAVTDETPLNNSITYQWVVDNSAQKIPVREKFENSASWQTIAPSSPINWSFQFTNFGQSLYYPSYTNTTKGDEAWLVSPLLDFSGAIESSLTYDVSYGMRVPGNERLKILMSEDCGLTYPITLLNQTGDFFNVQNTTLPWKPTLDDHWQSGFINLNSFTGRDNLRIAFVLTNDNGNNLYLDNLEFFEDDNPNPPRITDNYSVYSSTDRPFDIRITFNLPEKETARIQVYNLLGQLLVDETLTETLNQTYTIDLANQTTGIYIARLYVGGQVSSHKLFVGR